MVKAFTAFTQEIDDVDIAVSEIMEQLDLSRLEKSSVGILTCYAEFIDTGVVKALCDRLPFDVIGCTTMGNATNGNLGHLELNLMVLTGDDVEFSAAVSDALSEEQDAPLRQMYARAAKRLDSKPVCIISFMPLLYQIGGEVFLDILDDVSHLPVFGTLAVDHTTDYHESRTIYNGQVYADALSLVVVAGNVKPKFMVTSLDEAKKLKQTAIITDSAANILKEVNGIPAVEYMRSLGLTNSDGQIEGPSTIPFVVNFNDGTKPVIRAIFAQTPEGYAVCGGGMPVNSTLSIGSIDAKDVLDTTFSMCYNISVLEENHAVLLFSCIGRNYALGINTKAELEMAEQALGSSVAYQFAYSGGEICPLYDSDGILKNRFHNDTIIACIL